MRHRIPPPPADDATEVVMKIFVAAMLEHNPRMAEILCEFAIIEQRYLHSITNNVSDIYDELIY